MGREAAKPWDAYDIVYVDGYKIRNTLDDDFGLIEVYTDDISVFAPNFYIPRGEIWIDAPFKGETDFLLQTLFFAELNKVDPKTPYQEVRRLKKEKLCMPLPKGKKYAVKSEMRKGMKVVYVDGALVRKHLDPDFILGGHSLVYDYIPKGEIWLDVFMNQEEVPYIFIHEKAEYQLMNRGLSYEAAHDIAIAEDKASRRKDKVGFYPSDLGYPWDGLLNEEIISKNFLLERAPSQLSVKHFRQSKGLCGPASLKILFSHFGKDFTEEQLQRLAGATTEAGAEHGGLIHAAQSLGAYVFAKENGTAEELDYFLNQEKLPVIFGWFDGESDHYSVAVRATDKHLIYVNPESDKPKSRLPLSKFPNVWFDFPGKENREVSWRWYMVATFEKKEFSVSGGVYYDPLPESAEATPALAQAGASAMVKK